MKLNFDNTYLSLPTLFYTQMNAEAFSSSPQLVHANPKVAKLLELSPESLADPNFPLYFSGNKNFEGAESYAMAYAGYQFGQYAGQLGDGRALVLGQVSNAANDLWEVQLKGAGLTPYSRFGDGRAVMRSCIREYLCSEAMFGLDIPTSRALSIVATGEQVRRETYEPGAILTRVAPSHIRFGHFEHAFYTNHEAELEALVDHVIDTYHPKAFTRKKRLEQWFEEVVKRTANLIAQWQSVGFAHGVMNTDNMSILGITIDYGPFGFMEKFEPGMICNHSDHEGRYAYDQQPQIGLWNLNALAYALSPVLPKELSKEILEKYTPHFNECYERLMFSKLGLPFDAQNSKVILNRLLTLMAQDGADYTLTFRTLASSFENPQKWLSLFKDQDQASTWLRIYQDNITKPHKTQEKLLERNPKYILRNWVAEKVTREVEDTGETQGLESLLKILHSPYAEHTEHEELSQPCSEPKYNKSISCSS